MKCPECNGLGYWDGDIQNVHGLHAVQQTCHHCDGKGAVPAEVDPWPDNALEGGVFYSSDNREGTDT